MRAVAFIASLASCGGVVYRDLALEGAFAATMVADALQTEVITAQCRESNRIIGACGELVPPAVYFPAVVLLHAALSAAIPNGPWRNVWQAFTLGIAAKAVHTNHTAGIRLEW